MRQRPVRIHEFPQDGSDEPVGEPSHREGVVALARDRAVLDLEEQPEAVGHVEEDVRLGLELEGLARSEEAGVLGAPRRRAPPPRRRCTGRAG